MSLPDLIMEARKAALAPEQSLLRMLDQRKASLTILRQAMESYERAAASLRRALELIKEARGARDED